MIVLDNCVPHRYLRLLRQWGYDTALVSDHIAADTPDTEVIALAKRLDAVLLTVDLDFANILHYPPANYGGIIVIRYQPQTEAELDATLKMALADLYRDDLRGSLVIILPQRYRVRS